MLKKIRQQIIQQGPKLMRLPLKAMPFILAPNSGAIAKLAISAAIKRWLTGFFAEQMAKS